MYKEYMNFSRYENVSKYVISKIDGMTHLNLNEFDFSHHPEFMWKTSIYFDNSIISQYYDTKLTAKLNKKLATFNNVYSNNILLTHGADSLLETLVNVYLQPNDIARIIVPTYGGYERFCKLRDIKIIKSLLPNNITENMIFICNPNNPNGKKYNTDYLEGLISHHPNTLFVLDETYIDFLILSGDKRNTCSSLVDRYKNLFIIRSFSKAFGLAGMRLGYLISHKSNIEYLNTIINMYST
jgi:histidinol-phosphate/aromatic aminotransferase/cobyric acid decarboxylase-like protein